MPICFESLSAWLSSCKKKAQAAIGKMHLDEPKYETIDFTPKARPDTRIERSRRRWNGFLAGGLVIAGAFASGMWLGHQPRNSAPSPGLPASAVASLFASQARDQCPLEASTAPKPPFQPSRTLRVRATARVSSGNARTGESVLFLTEHAMQTVSGEHVPAGTLVEAVIARARPSSVKTPGRLVIEIRALHVGNQAIPLHALPYIPRSTNDGASTPDEVPSEIDIRALGIRNQLRPNPEVVMPKESVIEFQLVEADPAESPLRSVPEPDSPLPVLELPGNPSAPRPSLRLPVPDAKPPIPLRRPRIATERG